MCPLYLSGLPTCVSLLLPQIRTVPHRPSQSPHFCVLVCAVQAWWSSYYIWKYYCQQKTCHCSQTHSPILDICVSFPGIQSLWIRDTCRQVYFIVLHSSHLYPVFFPFLPEQTRHQTTAVGRKINITIQASDAFEGLPLPPTKFKVRRKKQLQNLHFATPKLFEKWIGWKICYLA